MKTLIGSMAAVLLFGTAVWGNTVTINGGTYTGCYSNGSDTTTINDGQFTNNGTTSYTYGLWNSGGTVFLKGGKITASGSEWVDGVRNDGNSALYVSAGVVTATSPSQSGTGLENWGTATITGGTFTGNSSTAWGTGIENWGTAIISGGTFTGSSSRWGTGIENNGIAYISGGTFTGSSSANWSSSIINNRSAQMRISGGKFVSYPYGSADGIQNDGTLTIVGIFGQYGYLPQGSGWIRGTLYSGESIYLCYTNHGTMLLTPNIPEPSSVLALLTGLAGVSCLASRKRR